jgi:ADP-ribose pyrophosphatase
MLRKKLLDTPRFNVERREYDSGGESPIVRDIVVHPGAVVILPILDPGRIVMIRNYRHAVDATLWELPAGTREPDEPVVETAGRELIEETGYHAGHLEPLIAFYTSPGILSERMHAFVATDLAPGDQALEHGEQIDVEVVGMNRVRTLMTDGSIQDGKTLAVLGLYFLGSHQ